MPLHPTRLTRPTVEPPVRAPLPTRRFVNVKASNPFSGRSPYSSRPTTPEPFDSSDSDVHPSASAESQHLRPHPPSRNSTDRTTLWRPSTGGPVKVIHFGPGGPSGGEGWQDGAFAGGGLSAKARQGSEHSLKTLSRGRGEHARPSPLGGRGVSAGGYENEDGDEDGDGRGTSVYGTMVSYRTAREGGGTTYQRNGNGGQDGTGVVRMPKGTNDARMTLKEIWSRDGEAQGDMQTDGESVSEREREREQDLEEARGAELRHEEVRTALVRDRRD